MLPHYDHVETFPVRHHLGPHRITGTVTNSFSEWTTKDHSSQSYVPASISSYKRLFTNHGDIQNTSLINSREVDRLPRSGSGLFLSLPDSDGHNPQPSLPGPKADYLMGHLPTYEVSERGQVDSEVYGIWVDMGRGIVVSCPFSPSVTESDES